jgi:hypothetical protein
MGRGACRASTQSVAWKPTERRAFSKEPGMKINSRMCAFALTVGMAVTPIVPVVAQPTPIQDRDHDRDNDRNRDHDRDHDRNNNQWTNNKYYKMGLKDADNDRKHNRRDRHHRNFKHDDDRRAYEAGYNERWPH